MSGGSTGGVTIRAMSASDADAVLRIYQQGMETGDATFETRAPTWAEFDARRLPGHRLVAVDAGDAVLGWVAVSPYSSRPVYTGVVEHGVYVDPGARGMGIGLSLMRALIASTEAAGIWTMQAGVFPENKPSISLHRSVGWFPACRVANGRAWPGRWWLIALVIAAAARFREVGTRERIACHYGRWRDVVLLERRSPVAGNGNRTE